MSQLAQARQILLTIQINSDPKKQSEPPDITDFLPYPVDWAICTSSREVEVNRNTAIEFLNTFRSFGSSVEFAFDPWLKDIKLSAQI